MVKKLFWIFFCAFRFFYQLYCLWAGIYWTALLYKAVVIKFAISSLRLKLYLQFTFLNFSLHASCIEDSWKGQKEISVCLSGSLSSHRIGGLEELEDRRCSTKAHSKPSFLAYMDQILRLFFFFFGIETATDWMKLGKWFDLNSSIAADINLECHC